MSGLDPLASGVGADPLASGVGLNILSYGDHGPRVAFLHGLFGQGRNWATLGRQLAAEGYRVALPDLPDHGRSDWTTAVDYVEMASSLATELRRLGAGWSLVGHSMGGKVAMLVALLHPRLVDRLCVVDIAPVPVRLGMFADYVRGMRGIDLGRLADRAQADAELRAAVPDDVIRAFLLQNLRRDGDGWRWQMNLRLLGDHLQELGGWPAVPCRPYPGPVLWVAGTDSDYVRPEHAEVMRALFPQARLIRVKHAGHWVHTEQPAVFGATLHQFLPPAATG